LPTWLAELAELEENKKAVKIIETAIVTTYKRSEFLGFSLKSTLLERYKAKTINIRWDEGDDEKGNLSFPLISYLDWALEHMENGGNPVSPSPYCYENNDSGCNNGPFEYYGLNILLSLKEADLKTDRTYHYRIVLEDSEGNQLITSERRFLLLAERGGSDNNNWLHFSGPYPNPEEAFPWETGPYGKPHNEGVVVNDVRWIDLLEGDDRAGILLEDRLAFSVGEFSGRPGIPIDFFLESSKDVRFPQRVHLGMFTSESVAGDESRQFSEFRFVKWDKFLSCVPYTLTARAISGDPNDDLLGYGAMRESPAEGWYGPVVIDGKEVWVANPVWGKERIEKIGYCGKIEISASPQMASCGEPASNILNVKLWPITGYDIPIDHLVFGRKNEDGSDDIFFNVVNPVSQETYLTQIPQSVLSQGENEWFARMVDSDGKVVEQKIILIGEHTEPTLRVTYPQNGQKVCAEGPNLLAIVFCAFFMGGCDGRESKTYSLCIMNMTSTEITASEGNFDNRTSMLANRHVANERGIESFISAPWPRRLDMKWQIDGEWREQKIDLPPYPRNEGTPSEDPYLCIAFFEDRVIAFTEWHMPIFFEAEKKVLQMEEAARTQGLPGAVMMSATAKSVVIEEYIPQRNNTGEADGEDILPPLPECKNTDACILLGILENSAFVEACGIVTPEIKEEMRKAFAGWPVLKLPIPGLQQALSLDNPDRANLLAHILPYLKRIPSHEASIECGGRYAMMKNPVPTLGGDIAPLPEDALKRYQK
jgi:hypothetical protein